MIVVDIELSGDTPTEVCDYVAEKFPFNSVDHRIERRYDDRYELYYIIIELAQSDLTPEQEQHLNRCEYVRKYDTRKGGLDGKVLTSMLTLLIQLKNTSSWSKACQMVTENFPGEAVLSSADPNEGLRLKLNQVVLTDVQRDWMHLSAIGMWYIDEYQVIEPDSDGEKLAKGNERLRTQLNKAYQLLSNMPSNLREDNSMTHLWIAERDKWLNQQIVEA